MSSASNTERISLEVRAKARDLDVFTKVEQHLIKMLRLRANWNKQSLNIEVKGASGIDKIEKKLADLKAKLKDVGQSKIGDALSGDVKQIDRAVTLAKGKVAELSAEMGKLKSAQAARPSANLGPKMTETQANLRAYEAILAQAGDLKRTIAPSAAAFAKAENQVAAASHASGDALSQQSRILVEKKAALASAKAEVEKLTRAEQANTTATREGGDAAKAAQGKLKSLRSSTGLIKETFATGVGETRTISKRKGKSPTITDATDYEEQIRREAQQLKSRAAAEKATTSDKGKRIAQLDDEIDGYTRLQQRASEAGLQSRKLYDDLTLASERASKEQSKINRQIAETSKLTKDRARLGDYATRGSTLQSEASNQRKRQTGDASAQISSYRNESNYLRSLGREMKQTGDAGSVQFQRIAAAAAKADAEASKLEKTLLATTRAARQQAKVGEVSRQRIEIGKSAADQRKNLDGPGQIQSYRDQAKAIDALEQELRTLGKVGEVEQEKIRQASRAARAEADKLTRAIDEQTQTRRKNIAIDDALRAKSDAMSQAQNRRTIVGDDSNLVLQAHQLEAVQLRDLQTQMKALGLEGNKTYDKIGRAAANAETKAAALQRQIQQSTQTAQKRASFAQDVTNRVSSLTQQGYTVRDEKTTQRSDGTATRSVSLFKDNNDVREYRHAVIELDESMRPLNATFTETRKQLSATANRASWATRNFIDNTKTVVAWASSVIAYQAAFRAISATTEAVLRLQRSAAVLTAVFQGERTEAVQLKNELLSLAVAQGRAGDEALDAGIRFARLGLTRKQILEAVTVSLKAANVAEIDAATAAEQLSSIMAAYNLEANQLYTVLTRLNNVSNQYNTTNKDLLQGIARVGNLAKETGLELEQLIALVATGTGLTGRSGAEFGNAIKSIIVSLSNPEIQGKIDTLFDIDVRDSSGEIKKMDSLLRDLAVSYQFLSQAEKQELLQIVGKKQQAARLAVILQNYTTVQKNLVAALHDGNATERENADIRATLLSQLESLRSAYDQLATSATGAFNNGLVGKGASIAVRSLTMLIQVLEKGAGVFPVVIAAAGLFFFKFLKGAIALSNTNAQGSLLVNTLHKLKDVFRDLTVIVNMSEKQMIASGGATSRLIAKLHILSATGGTAGRAIAGLSRVLLFTVGNIAKLVGSIALIGIAFKVIDFGTQAWEAYQKRQEEANRAALGFSQNLNDLADGAKRLEVLKDTASYIKDIMGSASASDLTSMINDLADIGDFKAPDRDRLLGLANSGSLDALSKELDRITYDTAKAELEKIDATIAAVTNNISIHQGIIAQAKKDRDAYVESWTNAWGLIGDGPTEFNETIQTGSDAVDGLTQQLEELRSKSVELRTTVRSALVSEDQIKETLAAFSKQSEAIAALVGGDGAIGSVIADAMAAQLSGAADAGYLKGIEGEFDKTISELSGRLASATNNPAVAAFEQERLRLRNEVEALVEERAAMEALLNDPSGMGSLGAGLNSNLDTDLKGYDTRITAAQQAEQAYLEENTAIHAQSLGIKQLEADLVTEGERRVQSTGLIKQQIAEREKERQAILRQQEAALSYAHRLEQLQRVQRDTAASTAAYRYGRDETDRLRNQSSGVLNELADRQARARNLADMVNRAGPDSMLGESAGKVLQEDLVRIAVLSQTLETQRNALVARRYAIEAEIVEAKMRQNEETSKALGLASREDQLRAAFLARYQQSNGGERIGENTFQFLDQQTRQAVNQFTPEQAPISQGSDVDRLQRELARYQDFSAFLTNLDTTLAGVQQTVADSITAASQAGGLGPNRNLTQPDLPAGTTPVTINVGQGAIQLDIAEPLSRLTSVLTSSFNTRLSEEITAIKASFALNFARAIARGR